MGILWLVALGLLLWHRKLLEHREHERPVQRLATHDIGMIALLVSLIAASRRRGRLTMGRVARLS
jgi:hypothetical protein